METRQILKRANERMAVVDLESELLQNRIIFITGEINEETVATYQAELMYLASQIQGDKSKCPIRIYINSKGGEIYSTLGLYDVMQKYIEEGYIIQTRVMGFAASAASFLLMAGSPGYRSASKHSKIMIHQPSHGTFGTVTDTEIDLKEAVSLKEEMSELYKKHCGQDLSNLMERDKYLKPEEALKLGLIDKIS